ncbi:MAG: hypothetical protein Q9187_007587, partial [Circinaria calcarea]
KRFGDDPKLLWKLMDLMVEAGLCTRNEPNHEEILRLLAPAPDLVEDFRQMLARRQEYYDEVILWQNEHRAQIAYDISGPDAAEGQNSPLVLSINGLGLPAASWKPVISIVQVSDRPNKPQILTCDRLGQGATTARDPLDEQPGKETGYGHGFVDATKDLHEVLQAIAPQGSKPRRLVFVAASIAVHLARLYAQHYPGEVAGLLILDSNVGNQEFSDL